MVLSAIANKMRCMPVSCQQRVCTTGPCLQRATKEIAPSARKKNFPSAKFKTLAQLASRLEETFLAQKAIRLRKAKIVGKESYLGGD